MLLYKHTKQTKAFDKKTAPSSNRVIDITTPVLSNRI
jgi:hypothetical protein